jgi:hypothetical protein
MRRLQTQLRNALAQTFYTSAKWSDRFKDALELSGGVDEETGEECAPSAFDTVMHALSLFWKVHAIACECAGCPRCAGCLARVVCTAITLLTARLESAVLRERKARSQM